MLPRVDHLLLAMIHWHPRCSGGWCGVIIFAAAAWFYLLQHRMSQRVSPSKTCWLLVPKGVTLALVLLLLLNPVSTVQHTETTTGKLLVLVDSSGSMEVADDYHQSRAARARQIVKMWEQALPAGLSMDELYFDTTVHAPDDPPARRDTDLGGCLLSLAERKDLASYLGIALLTDGGDEPLENPRLPKLPLYVVGIGTDAATWNDVSVVGANGPGIAEQNVDFDISADLQARAGRGGDFIARLASVHILLEHAIGTNAWEKTGEQMVDLSNLRRLVHFPVKCSEAGLQRYRVRIEPVTGELATSNNTRLLTVNVQRKSVRVLFFSEELGQEFKVLRNELAHDPGIAFTALFRTSGRRFVLQGDRQAGDEGLTEGLPATEKGLAPYNVLILGSFPAEQLLPNQMQAIEQFCEHGGTVIFLGGDAAFGRGGYAGTTLAALFPWRISGREPAPAHGQFPIHVPPTGAGNPLLAGIEEIVERNNVMLDAVNRVEELKTGAQSLLVTRVDGHELAVVATQAFGRGKVLAIASSTLWKWAMLPEPVRLAYGLLWRQAVRLLTGKTEGGQNLVVRWDKDFYRPGDLANAEIRVLGPDSAALQWAAILTTRNQPTPLTVVPAAGQPTIFQVNFRFRERGDFLFHLAAYQGSRMLETYEKNFPVTPLLPEGSRLEIDSLSLKKLAEAGGGTYFPESEARQLPEQFAGKCPQKTTIQESSLAETGPWFLLVFLSILAGEWIMRRKYGLF